MIKKVFTFYKLPIPLIARPTFTFAKDDKPKGKKEQPSAYIPPPKEIPHQEIVRAYLQPVQSTLSPSEIRYKISYQRLKNEKFSDLSEQQKLIIDSFAQEIVDLRSQAFFQFARWGGLGTSDAYYVATQPPSEQQLRYT